jgi:hypothetical protein
MRMSEGRDEESEGRYEDDRIEVANKSAEPDNSMTSLPGGRSCWYLG